MAAQPSAARFSCSTLEDGVISSWNPSNGTTAVVQKDFGSAAVYKGLAISDPGTSDAVLYATNFHAGTIEAYNSSFAQPSLAGTFTDPNLPSGYAPFNDKVINGELYVTYAKQDALKHDDEAGAGNGFVDIFNLDGTLKERLISQGALELAMGPRDRAVKLRVSRRRSSGRKFRQWNDQRLRSNHRHVRGRA